MLPLTRRQMTYCARHYSARRRWAKLSGMAFPIDYDAIRTALVAAVRTATGLGQNAVIVMEAEQPVGVRPQVPFAALKFTSLSIKAGWDGWAHAGLSDDQAGVFTYSGQRSLVVAFDFFGETHEQAYGLAAALQAGLDIDAVWGQLDAAGLAVWRVDQVVDASELLNTGYEGRAHLTVQFGTMATTQVDVGYIAHVPVAGVVNNAGKTPVEVSFTADISED